MNFYRIFSKIYELAAQKMCRDCQNFIKKGDRILDLGCGSGIVAKAFQDFFQAKIIGVDVKDNRVVPVDFKVIDGKNLEFPENSFDIVLINYVLHHSKDQISLLKESKRVCKNKIIIYEDLPQGIVSKLLCKIHGISFNKFFKIENPAFFKTSEEWHTTFENLGLRTIFEKNVSCILNPVKKKLFVLEKI